MLEFSKGTNVGNIKIEVMDYAVPEICSKFMQIDENKIQTFKC